MNKRNTSLLRRCWHFGLQLKSMAEFSISVRDKKAPQKNKNSNRATNRFGELVSPLKIIVGEVVLGEGNQILGNQVSFPICRNLKQNQNEFKSNF